MVCAVALAGVFVIVMLAIVLASLVEDGTC